MSGKKEKKAAAVQKQEEEEEAPELINAEEGEHVHGEHCDHDHDDFSSDDEGEVTDPQELLLQMLYDCEEADDVEEYINILETTLLAAKGRHYQLKLEESKPKEKETNANQSPASQVLALFKDNLTVDCLHQEHNEATQEETIMLTLRISALPSLEEEAEAEEGDAPNPIDAILWWHYDSLTSEVVDEDGPPDSTNDVEVDIRFRLAWAVDGDDPETAQQLISFDTSSDDPQEQNPSNLKANREQVRLLLEFLLQRRSKDEKALATAGGLQTNFWNLIVSYIAPALHSAKHQKALAQQLRQAFIAASGSGASSSSSSSGKQQKKPAEGQGQGQKRKAEGGAAGQQPAKKQQQGQQGKGQQQQQGKQKQQQQQQGQGGKKKNKNKGGKQ